MNRQVLLCHLVFVPLLTSLNEAENWLGLNSVFLEICSILFSPFYPSAKQNIQTLTFYKATLLFLVLWPSFFQPAALLLYTELDKAQLAKLPVEEYWGKIKNAFESSLDSRLRVHKYFLFFSEGGERAPACFIKFDAATSHDCGSNTSKSELQARENMWYWFFFFFFFCCRLVSLVWSLFICHWEETQGNKAAGKWKDSGIKCE